MNNFKVIENPEAPDYNPQANCLDCSWSGAASECYTDYEYDEFWGCDRPYSICPKCSNGVEIS
jgi:hypothetical protein